jgi:hypothetical protein
MPIATSEVRVLKSITIAGVTMPCVCIRAACLVIRRGTRVSKLGLGATMNAVEYRYV